MVSLLRGRPCSLHTPHGWSAVVLAGLCFASCGGSSGSNGAEQSAAGFAVSSWNLQDGATWQINRPIRIEFTQPVDFSSINLASINVRQVGGANSTGEFFLEDSSTVVFQPNCPTAEDFSDAAFVPGGLTYELTIVGDDQQAGFSVRSAQGESLAVSERRTLLTPESNSAEVLFFDFVTGAPRPLVRGRDGVGLNDLFATHIEVGGQAGVQQRLYFEETGAGIALRDEVGVVVPMPLNLLSESTTQVSAVVYMNQPLSPESTEQAAVWEFQANPNDWRELNTRTELLANCTSTGAILRSTPLGALPSGVPVRISLATTLADLSGESNLANLDDFALAVTQVAPAGLSDEVFEDFVLAESNAPSETLHDFAAALSEPPAVWENGRLSHGFDFDGNGGPGSNFDVSVGAGEVLIFNTSSAVVTGGPGFSKAETTIYLGGVMNVHNLLVEEGGLLRFQGPNAATILATGDIQIFGDIDVSGTGFTGVVTLNTTVIPEGGATGQCGGGRGGDGSPLTNASSPRGSRGRGAFNTPDGGGQGGEAGWSTANADDDRRGAGGGGGAFGADQLQLDGNLDESLIGLNTEAGFDGNANAFGAEEPESQTSPPNGGLAGPRPFNDGDPSNDFFGRRVDEDGVVTIGELTQPWAGAGGGGGGDASEVIGASGIYPDVPFRGGGDEKGAGGGGGGGSLSILALGDIVFGRNGQVRARGGFGGGGESTNYVNRIGSASGGGSGGHVILQTASTINFAAKLGGLNARPAILATGGQGGAGAEDEGGASLIGGSTETPVSMDACPDAQLGCLGFLEGAGGDGGPGLVQLHSPSGLVGEIGDILLPDDGGSLRELCFPAPLEPLQPAFGRSSAARSIWIRLGEGGFDLNNPDQPQYPRFQFDGTDLATGAIQSEDGRVLALPSILDQDAAVLKAGPELPFVAADEFTLVLDADTLPLAFRVAPGRLRRYQLDFDSAGTEGVNFRRFRIVSASYDSVTNVILVTTDMSGAALTSFGSPENVDVRLRPTFFEVESEGEVGRLPENSDVTVLFQAAPRNPLTGGPDEAEGRVSAWETDIGELSSADGNGDASAYQFIRFMVRFDIDKGNQGLDANLPRPNINFLRIPFSYE